MKLNRENINTKEYWDKRYFELQHNEPAIRSVSNFFEYGFVPKNKDISILEIGCGCATHYPYIHEKYPNAKFTGLDISKYACVFNKAHYKFADFIELNVDKQDIPGKYDYIISAHTFEHLDNPVNVINKCISICKDKVIIVVPYGNNWSYDFEHIHIFTEQDPFLNYTRYCMEPPTYKTIFFEFDGKYVEK